MKSYTPPIADIEKGLKALERLSMDVANPAIDALDPETQSAILQEAARFATEILSPLNALGDQQGAQLEKGQVSMPEGFKQVYHQFCQQGWSQAGVDEAYGGQPLPMVLMVALYEMFNGANAAFSLLPMLNFGAILTLAMVADDVLKERYVGEMVAGHLSAAMVLTEAEAGSDMSAIRTYAIAEEGSDCYRVFGQKQFITYGDHDLTPNLIHLVVVRTSHREGGLRGLSLMVVPKFLPDGSRNHWQCLSIEEKMGIHASPTATIVYGEGEEGAIGYLVGRKGRGLEYFYLLMRLARLLVAAQSVGLSDAAYQMAQDYARHRLQGFMAGHTQRVPILRHPDICRMLSTMRATVQAMRAGLYRVAIALDRAAYVDDENTRAFEQNFADLMIPTFKAFCSDQSVVISSEAVQIFGGMGYIEETGIAQYFRDARIGPIYEGTNGIQALEVVMRQVGRDRGKVVFELIEKITYCQQIINDAGLSAYRAHLLEAVEALRMATQWISVHFEENPDSLRYAAYDYLTLLAIVVCGWQLGCIPSTGIDSESIRRHYQDEMLLQASWRLEKIRGAGERWALGYSTFMDASPC